MSQRNLRVIYRIEGYTLVRMKSGREISMTATTSTKLFPTCTRKGADDEYAY